MEPRQIVVDLGRAEAILPFSEQAPTDRYRPGLNLKVLLKSVELTVKGPELIVSRTEGLLLRRLFEMEVPEIYHGAVEIVAIAREPGFRSKVAVRARQDGVDPVGSCVGLRGVRIQNIVNELQGEKIDVVEWNKDPARFIANALNPSQVMRVDLDADTNIAVAVVPDRQLSLAIGKEGQNARLAAKLTGWSVDIRSSVDTSRVSKETPVIVAESELDMLGLSTRTFNVLKNGGVTTVGHILKMTRSDLLAIKSFGEKSYGELQDRLKALRLPPTIVDEPAPAEEPEQVSEEAPTEAISEVAPESVGIEEPAVAEETVAAKDTADAGQPEEEVTEAAPEPTPEPEPAPAAETAPIEEPTPALPPEIIEPLIEPEPEPVGAGPERFASLHDLPENTWAIRRGAAPEPGRIRFAEEIAGLRGGVMARRGRTADGGKGRKRKPKAGRRRR
jgi:transcription antitermination factor NusA-like protein